MAKFNPLAPATRPAHTTDDLPEHFSEQQKRAINFARFGGGNGTLRAVAGSGKTTTLIEMCSHLDGSVAFAAFNKGIAQEISLKLMQAGVDTRRVRAQTFHSFGFSAWRRVVPKVRVDGEKLQNIAKGLNVPRNLQAFARAAVSIAKQSCFGIDYDPTDDSAWLALVQHYDLEEKIYVDDNEVGNEGDYLAEGIMWAKRMLAQSIELNDKVIDFDDMLYAPLIHEAPFWLNDWVLIDEAQDTNNARLMIADKMLKPGGRLIAVGDPRQAIYGFTGANADSMNRIQERFACVDLPLTVSFRCARKIVEHAQQWAPEIEAAPNAPDGIVRSITEQEFRRLTPTPKDAILCRNTKPLIGMAFDYIRRRIPVHVEGRDIGQGLMRIVRKWRRPKTVGELREKIMEWSEREVAKFLDMGAEAKVQRLKDQVDSLFVIMDSLADDAPIKEIEKIIETLFRDTDEGGISRTVTLSTVHKAKGREWDRVYLYGRDKFMPSFYARQEWQLEQERNLIYVAVTRAKNELIEVELKRHEFDEHDDHLTEE